MSFTVLAEEEALPLSHFLFAHNTLHYSGLSILVH
jgi:hypothetical protein